MIHTDYTFWLGAEGEDWPLDLNDALVPQGVDLTDSQSDE